MMFFHGDESHGRIRKKSPTKQAQGYGWGRSKVSSFWQFGLLRTMEDFALPMEAIAYNAVPGAISKPKGSILGGSYQDL